jgi:hypothetical protein
MEQPSASSCGTPGRERPWGRFQERLERNDVPHAPARPTPNRADWRNGWLTCYLDDIVFAGALTVPTKRMCVRLYRAQERL